MGPIELAEEVRRRLKANADPKFREGLSWFFKEPVDPYGIRTPRVRQIAASAHKMLISWPAAVSFLQEAKRGRNTMAILSAAALLEDPDDMVRKGVGWLLKEAYPKKPREVMKFVRACQHCAPRLVLRIAAEKMTAEDRAKALGRAG